MALSLDLRNKLSVLKSRRHRAVEALESRLLYTTNAWASAVSGDWTDATKWSLKHVPLATEDVSITLAGSYTVKHATTASNTAKSITVTNGSLELDAGTLTVTGAVKVTSGALTLKGGTLAKATLSNSGSGKIVTTTSAGALDGVTLASTLNMSSGSTIDLRHTITFSNSAKLLTNNSKILLQDSTDAAGVLAGTGEILLGGSSGSTITADNSHGHSPSVSIGVLIDGVGTATFTGGINNGTIQADVAGKTLVVSGSLTNKNQLIATKGATLQLKTPTTFTNQGSLTASAGTILSSGSLNLGSGSLTIGIGGTGQGSTFGLLNVQGVLTEKGTFTALLLSGYTPSASSKFTVFKYNSASGSFTTSNLVSGSTTFLTSYASTSMTLSIQPVATTPTLTMAYTSLQIATNSTFTTGLQTITLSGTSANNITIPHGDYFRFGMTGTVTGTTNPAAGKAWDLANQKINGAPAQPKTLGMGLLFMKLYTTSDLATVVAPVGVKSGSTIYSTAVIGPTLTPAFSITSKGDVKGGDVGTSFQLGGGTVGISPDNAAGVAELAAFTKTDSLFTNLSYKAVAAGKTTITPLVDTTAVLFNQNTSIGTVDSKGNPVDDAVYQEVYDPTKDTIKNASVINITVT